MSLDVVFQGFGQGMVLIGAVWPDSQRGHWERQGEQGGYSMSRCDEIRAGVGARAERMGKREGKCK